MIELYSRADCPFCQKVIAAAKGFGLVEGKDFKIIPASQNTPGREIVLKVGGKAMVPFLIDGDHSMYESNDIIAYFKSKVN